MITTTIKKNGCPDCDADAILTFHKAGYCVSLMAEKCADGCGFDWEINDNE